MSAKLILLPGRTLELTRLVKTPEHYDGHEAFRHTTGLIAGVEESNPDCTWDDIAEELEAHGFEVLDYILGPEIR
ncbi:hypothetical protein MNBD_GAMMA26-167 [hydrothermal vent metagenome]|uniref:Uncharacterized protein n=1 Tax=hydrothermal vent metagenome TaxID=652676 RepID=A0A3B1C0G5_9ZZZZ